MSGSMIRSGEASIMTFDKDEAEQSNAPLGSQAANLSSTKQDSAQPHLLKTIFRNHFRDSFALKGPLDAHSVNNSLNNPTGESEYLKSDKRLMSESGNKSDHTVKRIKSFHKNEDGVQNKSIHAPISSASFVSSNVNGLSSAGAEASSSIAEFDDAELVALSSFPSYMKARAGKHTRSLQDYDSPPLRASPTRRLREPSDQFPIDAMLPESQADVEIGQVPAVTTHQSKVMRLTTQGLVQNDRAVCRDAQSSQANSALPRREAVKSNDS